MTACFADTFYFLAMLNPRDVAHAQVTQFNASFQQPIVTSAWVLMEVADGLAHPANRALFSALIERLKAEARATIVPPESQLFEQAVQLYKNRPDKHWSLTDCTSFLIMQHRGMTEALTADHHFEQAGFNALLK